MASNRTDAAVLVPSRVSPGPMARREAQAGIEQATTNALRTITRRLDAIVLGLSPPPIANQHLVSPTTHCQLECTEGTSRLGSELTHAVTHDIRHARPPPPLGGSVLEAVGKA
jgi:hypothetical protein